VKTEREVELEESQSQHVMLTHTCSDA